jgi:hypothetical protein
MGRDKERKRECVRKKNRKLANILLERQKEWGGKRE